MKLNKLIALTLTAAGLLSFSSCSNSDPESPKAAEVSASVSLPDNLMSAEVISCTYQFTNLTSGIVSTGDDPSALHLEPGLYDVIYEAQLQTADGLISKVHAVAHSVQISSGGNTLNLVAYLQPTGDDLVIAEIFFAGTQQSSGNNYVGDDYIKLYNNTDHVVYADGISIFESDFMTTQKFDYTPDIMDHAMSVDAIYTIPGNGTEYPVQPGEYLLIADNAIDHRASNPNSFDLSHADFEWYDESTTPNFFDIDNPTVKNLDKWYSYTKSVFMLHNRGFKAYGIARIPQDCDSFLKDNLYQYEYEMVLAAGTFPMDGEGYKISNECILDVVNLSVESERVWNVCHSSLDAGWTFCGTIDKDPTRFFHSVRRKMTGLTEDGKPVLQDTNNSSVDFNPNCIPSEIEMQASAIDYTGAKASTLTYDGVTPKN